MSGIRIKARIDLLASSEGGRLMPIRGSYRPNHNFGSQHSHEMATGFLDFADGEAISPGESKEMEIILWPYPGLEAIVTPGRKWQIQEGGKVVGNGEVIEVLD